MAEAAKLSLYDAPHVAAGLVSVPRAVRIQFRQYDWPTRRILSRSPMPRLAPSYVRGLNLRGNGSYTFIVPIYDCAMARRGPTWRLLRTIPCLFGVTCGSPSHHLSKEAQLYANSLQSAEGQKEEPHKDGEFNGEQVRYGYPLQNGTAVLSKHNPTDSGESSYVPVVLGRYI